MVRPVAISGFWSFIEELRPLVVADGGIVRFVCTNALNLLLIHFRIGGGFRLPKYFSADHEVAPLLACEVFFNEDAGNTPEVVDAVREIPPEVDFPVWTRDLYITFMRSSRFQQATTALVHDA